MPWDQRLTPEQYSCGEESVYERVCQANPDAVLELDADGQLIVMTPTGGETGCRLTDGFVLSRAASLVWEQRWLELSPDQHRSFPPGHSCGRPSTPLVSRSEAAALMTIASAPSPAPPTQPPLELAPLRLPWDLRLTPEQFERVCQANPDAVLELDADGHLIAMTPTGGETGARNLRLSHLLLLWADGPGAGAWQVFDSSTGFRLPDGSVLSPDASLLRQARWQALTPEERRGFPPLCPDLVVELASPSDEGPCGVTSLRRKMGRYQANGARLGWLLLPEERAVEIWRGGQERMAERLENPTRLEGDGEFAGLVVELEEIWGV